MKLAEYTHFLWQATINIMSFGSHYKEIQRNLYQLDRCNSKDSKRFEVVLESYNLLFKISIIRFPTNQLDLNSLTFPDISAHFSMTFPDLSTQIWWVLREILSKARKNFAPATMGYSIWNPQGGGRTGKNLVRPPPTFFFSRMAPLPFLFFTDPPVIFLVTPPPPRYIIDTPPPEHFIYVNL